MIWNPIFAAVPAPWRDLASADALRGPARFPAIRAHLTEDAVAIEALLPGVRPETLELAMDEDQLVLEGELATIENARALRRERSSGRFRRRLQLPFAVDGSAVQAELENGLLRVRLPRRADSGPRRITIQTKTKGDDHATS